MQHIPTDIEEFYRDQLKDVNPEHHSSYETGTVLSGFLFSADV